MLGEYRVYIVGTKENIDKVLQEAQNDELIDSYQIGD